MTVAVVDASVLVAAALDTGPTGRWAEQRLLDLQMAAPHLVLAEASNILRRAALAGDVTDREATLAHADLMALDVELLPFEPFAPRVWSLRANLTAYDAWYVAVAEEIGCSVLTLDGRLARAPGLACTVELPPR